MKLDVALPLEPPVFSEVIQGSVLLAVSSLTPAQILSIATFLGVTVADLTIILNALNIQGTLGPTFPFPLSIVLPGLAGQSFAIANATGAIGVPYTGAMIVAEND